MTAPIGEIEVCSVPRSPLSYRQPVILRLFGSEPKDVSLLQLGPGSFAQACGCTVAQKPVGN